MIKNFPKSRICAINVYPALCKGIQKTLSFSKVHQVPINSSDGKRILLSYCLESINETLKQNHSPFPKVCFLNKSEISSKIKTFVIKHFAQLMSKTTMPYCGIIDINSPDLESAAQAALQLNKKTSTFENFKKTHLRLKVS